MKRLGLSFIVCFLVTLSCVTSGSKEKITEPVIFAEIVEANGISQETLFTRTNMWLVDVFRNAESVIQFSDKESGVIKGKYIDNGILDGMFICRVYSTITIEIREGRYRISFSDPTYYYIGDTVNGTPPNYGINDRKERPVETIDLANNVKESWIKLAENLKVNINQSGSSW